MIKLDPPVVPILVIAMFSFAAKARSAELFAESTATTTRPTTRTTGLPPKKRTVN